VQKQNIRSLFDSIAHRYDFLNHVLSGGTDYLWRRRAIDHLRDLHPLTILDVATGTADFALAAMQLGPQEVVGIDISEQMLNRGRAKIIRRGFDRTIALRTGDAENLEFPNDRFDAAIVAFRRILPLIGRIVSGDRQAYNHLPETVMRFPQGEAFLAILRKIGFALAEDDRLTFGIASIYTGTKPLR
jgi:demethylmenaquinone methyltransferase/2-methoxy-6-polyprenyl-1,4-benzoquinol methylase